MAGLQPLSTRAFGPRLRRLTALTALATRPLIATKRPTARCGQSVCKCHAEKSRSANFARILTAVHRPGGNTSRGPRKLTDVDVMEVIVDLPNPATLKIGMQVDVYFRNDGAQSN
jgi:hypothetical protein